MTPQTSWTLTMLAGIVATGIATHPAHAAIVPTVKNHSNTTQWNVANDAVTISNYTVTPGTNQMLVVVANLTAASGTPLTINSANWGATALASPLTHLVEGSRTRWFYLPVGTTMANQSANLTVQSDPVATAKPSGSRSAHSS